jgi:hypothetical protein
MALRRRYVSSEGGGRKVYCSLRFVSFPLLVLGLEVMNQASKVNQTCTDSVYVLHDDEIKGSLLNRTILLKFDEDSCT